MSTLTYPQLVAACEPGAATALSLVTELAPAGGAHAGVAPACSAVGRNTVTFGYQTRFVDGQPATAVIIDARHSQLNRVEAAILQAIRDEDPVLSRVPRIQLCYDDGRACYTDLELPQRVFDSQILAGTVDGGPVSAHPGYRAARECTPADARALLELSPGSLVFGACDVARKPRADGYRGALTGEIIGVLAERDPVGVSIEPAPSDAAPTVAAAPTLRSDGVIGCRRIIRTQVLNFAVLRQLRFDAGPAGDAACRALLAAYALAGLARSNAELTIRPGCDLVEAGPTSVQLDARNGDFIALDPSSIADADAVLLQALDQAKLEADIRWQGQVFDITGDPAARAAVGAEQRPFWRAHLVAGRGHPNRR